MVNFMVSQVAGIFSNLYTTLTGTAGAAKDAFRSVLTDGARLGLEASGLNSLKPLAERFLQAQAGGLLEGTVDGLKVECFKTFLKEGVIAPLNLFFEKMEGGSTPLLHSSKEKITELLAEIDNKESTFETLKAKLDALQAELTKTFGSGNVLIENMSFTSSLKETGAPKKAPAKEAAAVVTRETYVSDINQELDKLRTNIVRKTQLQVIFGDQIPDKLKDFSKENFHHEALNEISQKAKRSSGSFIIIPLLDIYDRVVFWLTGFFTNYYIGKVTESLKYHLSQLKEENDKKNKQAVLDAIYGMLFDGLHMYTSELINTVVHIASEAEKGVALSGTPDDMIQKSLEGKSTLRAGKKSQEDFYKACFSSVLNKIFIKPTGFFAPLKKIQQLFDRFIIKTLINQTGYLKDPFKFVANSTIAQNDITLKIDTFIIELLEPIVDQLKSGEDAESAERSESSAKNYFYSQGTKQKLRQALQALFKSSTLLGCSDLGVVQAQADKIKKQPSLISTDKVLFETAEVAAISILDSIDGAVSEKNYFFSQSLNILQTINKSFVPATKTEAEPKVADRKKEIASVGKKRSDLLTELAKITIEKAIRTVPILNPEISFNKMNQFIANIKDQAKCFIDVTDETIEEYESSLLTLEQQVTHNTQLNFDQKAQIKRSFDHLKEFIETYKKSREADAKVELQHTLSAYIRDTKDSVYEPRALISVLNVPALKTISCAATGMVVRTELEKLYPFFTHPLTLKYYLSHQSIAQLLKI